MEKALTKYFWVLNLTMIAAISALLANGFGEVIATSVSDSLPGYKDEPKHPTQQKNRRKAYKADGTPILERNMFDSVTGPIFPEDEEDDESFEDETPVDMGGLPVVPCTSSRIKIMVIMADKNDQQWSFASINDGSENKIIKVGDKVENRTVAGISRRYLFLSNSSEICYLDMFPDEKPKPGRKKPRAVAANDKKGMDFKNGVQVISETERIVDRSLVDKVLASPEKFIRSVRVRAQRRNGKITGYKLRRFRKNSPLALLGAKKNDVIHAVNGQELSGAEQALSLYSSLRSESDLVFSITRKGKPMDLTIKIR